MQVSIETTSKLERRLTVGVPAETVDTQVDERLRQAVKNVRLPGFRPGKVPLKVMRQRFGPGVRQEVLGEVMSRSFQEAVTQEKLKPAGQPTIEPRNMDAGKDLEYIATFEVFPDVEIVELKGYPVDKPAAEVSSDDVDNIIEVFRKQRGSWEEAGRPAADGDRVNIDFEGTRDGEAFEGGSAEGSDLELGSGQMIPGFEDGVVGMTAGDEKVLSLSFPDDYHADELKGAAVEFKVTLNKVQEMQLAPLDAELYAAYGLEGDDEGEFRAEVEQNMARELRNAVDARVKKQVMDAVVEAYADLDVPAALISQETDALRNQMFQQFGGSAPEGMDLKAILPDDMFAANAARRVKLGLVLAELIAHYELKADEDALRSAVEEIASTYQDPEEVVNWYFGNQEQLAAVQSKVLEDKVVERLLESAAINESVCTYQEAIALGQQANQ
ncbi:trigger factor [Congregibacter sp.]|jgi:trigger factor|uniref:trigger factor n=1 Tax=Congregibacter sp. TaxID=2744308 RepID=UPI0039E46313